MGKRTYECCMNCTERYLGCHDVCAKKKEVDDYKESVREAKNEFYKNYGYFRDKYKKRKTKWIKEVANGGYKR